MKRNEPGSFWGFIQWVLREIFTESKDRVTVENFTDEAYWRKRDGK